MTMTENNSNNMIEVSFEDELCEQLQSFRYSSCNADKYQVCLDLQRISSLEIKEKSVVTKIKPLYDQNGTTINQSQEILSQELNKAFFDKLKGLDDNLQHFVAQHFHQGGILFNGRSFLSYHINALGFQVNGEHKFVFEINYKDLIVEETFTIEALTFLPLSGVLKIVSKDSELAAESLTNDEKERILFFTEYIKSSLGISENQSTEGLRIRLGINPHSAEYLYMPGTSLIEFTVRHEIIVDSKEPKGIILKDLSKKDVKLRVQSDLYGLSSLNIDKPRSFKLLCPELPLSIPDPKSSIFFSKPTLKSKINNLALNTYREFILLLLNIIFNLISSPIPVKSPFLGSHQPRSNESNNSFAYRMRA